MVATNADERLLDCAGNSCSSVPEKDFCRCPAIYLTSQQYSPSGTNPESKTLFIFGQNYCNIAFAIVLRFRKSPIFIEALKSNGKCLRICVGIFLVRASGVWRYL